MIESIKRSRQIKHDQDYQKFGQLSMLASVVAYVTSKYGNNYAYLPNYKTKMTVAEQILQQFIRVNLLYITPVYC